MKLVFSFPSPRRFGEIEDQFNLQHFDLTSQLSFTSFIKTLLFYSYTTILPWRLNRKPRVDKRKPSPTPVCEYAGSLRPEGVALVVAKYESIKPNPFISPFLGYVLTNAIFANVDTIKF